MKRQRNTVVVRWLHEQDDNSIKWQIPHDRWFDGYIKKIVTIGGNIFFILTNDIVSYRNTRDSTIA